MLASLGLAGDGDDMDLVQDIERAFGIRFPGADMPRCHTVGDVFDVVLAQLPHTSGTADRCASAMCFHRIRRAALALSPGLDLRPSTPTAALRGVPVKLLHRALRADGALNPPAPTLAGWGVASLLLMPLALVAWALCGLPWWLASLVAVAAVPLCWLAPVRLSPPFGTFGDFVALTTARSMGSLAARGARLRPAEAWTALRLICADHAGSTADRINRATLILAAR